MGCCPAAMIIYADRYASNEYRCCTSKLGSIQKLRAVPDVGPLTTKYLYNSSMLIAGDSMAEQHWLSLVCSAWAEGLRTNVTKYRPNGRFLGWRATGSDLDLTFVRSNRPEVLGGIDYESPKVLVLAGWQHGNLEMLGSMLDEIAHLRPIPKLTMIAQALPSHFPSTSEAAERAACDADANATFPLHANSLIDRLVSRNHTRHFSVLRVHHLYATRGEAHVGILRNRTRKQRNRDCLHWCVAPGVLDPLAFVTLSNVAHLPTSGVGRNARLEDEAWRIDLIPLLCLILFSVTLLRAASSKPFQCLDDFLAAYLWPLPPS